MGSTRIIKRPCHVQRVDTETGLKTGETRVSDPYPAVTLVGPSNDVGLPRGLVTPRDSMRLVYGPLVRLSGCPHG